MSKYIGLSSMFYAITIMVAIVLDGPAFILPAIFALVLCFMAMNEEDKLITRVEDLERRIKK